MTPEQLRESAKRIRLHNKGIADWWEAAEIIDAHAAALEEIERLKGETETLRSLYNAKHPPHERRKCSTAHDGPIESFEELSSQSHWPECQCYECRAIFVMNKEHERAEQAERRAERLEAEHYEALLIQKKKMQEVIDYWQGVAESRAERGGSDGRP